MVLLNYYLFKGHRNMISIENVVLIFQIENMRAFEQSLLICIAS